MKIKEKDRRLMTSDTIEIAESLEMGRVYTLSEMFEGKSKGRVLSCLYALEQAGYLCFSKDSWSREEEGDITVRGKGA